MQIYIKSAGFSVNQDYTWVNRNGEPADIDLSILSYNVDGIKFVWKSTADDIYIFGNAFPDESRTDLYNRPLRNYILLTGRMGEAEALTACFEKMLLGQQYFEKLLNGSIQNESGSRTGFSVDFQRIASYLGSPLPGVREARKLQRHVYQKDTYEARQALLGELRGAGRTPVTFLVGGDLSDSRIQAIAPDRALLDHVSDAWTQKEQAVSFGKTDIPVKEAVMAGAAAAAAVSGIVVSIALWLSRKKD